METTEKQSTITHSEKLEREFQRVKSILPRTLATRRVILSGSSGVGKTTLANMLKSFFPNIQQSVSCTDREKRRDEIDGVHYYFLTKEKFSLKIESDELAEYNDPFETADRYGTLKSECGISQLSKIFVVDIKGAVNLKETYPDAVTIFIKPPNITILEKRLRERNDGTPEEKIKKRLARFNEESEFEAQADYVVVNDDKFDCIAELCAIVFQEMSGTIITFDGLTACGKGTLSKMLAEGLKGKSFDSGLLYRIITRELGIVNGISIEDLTEKVLDEFLYSFDFSKINDADYRTSDVDRIVPFWGKIPLIRDYAHYLEIKNLYGDGTAICIPEGRDMSTKVFCKAKYKFYISTSLGKRALWRSEQRKREYGFVWNEIANRDREDIGRPIDPVRFAPELGVKEIINESSPEEALLEILSYIN